MNKLTVAIVATAAAATLGLAGCSSASDSATSSETPTTQTSAPATPSPSITEEVSSAVVKQFKVDFPEVAAKYESENDKLQEALDYSCFQMEYWDSGAAGVNKDPIALRMNIEGYFSHAGGIVDAAVVVKMIPWLRANCKK